VSCASGSLTRRLCAVSSAAEREAALEPVANDAQLLLVVVVGRHGARGRPRLVARVAEAHEPLQQHLQLEERFLSAVGRQRRDPLLPRERALRREAARIAEQLRVRVSRRAVRVLAHLAAEFTCFVPGDEVPRAVRHPRAWPQVARGSAAPPGQPARRIVRSGSARTYQGPCGVPCGGVRSAADTRTRSARWRRCRCGALRTTCPRA
jgi:hypothetical protein